MTMSSQETPAILLCVCRELNKVAKSKRIGFLIASLSYTYFL